jgi:hypothetical protein
MIRRTLAGHDGNETKAGCQTTARRKTCEAKRKPDEAETTLCGTTRRSECTGSAVRSGRGGNLLVCCTRSSGRCGRGRPILADRGRSVERARLAWARRGGGAGPKQSWRAHEAGLAPGRSDGAKAAGAAWSRAMRRPEMGSGAGPPRSPGDGKEGL